MRIAEVIARDLSRPIEEIIKVTQHDEETVYAELDEYVVTRKIREEYRKLLRAMAEAPADPSEGVGVWVSGFFGSGKSAFAKNLGYMLANREVCGVRAAELLKTRLGDEQCGALVDSITARIPTEVVMFDVQTDRGGGSGAVSMAEYMYRALRRALGYAEDLNIANLEQSLEADGRLEEFTAVFEGRHRKAFEQDRERFAEQLAREQWRWEYRRKLAHKFNEASAALHEMDPATYPAPDTWARSLQPMEVTPALLVEKTFELAARRAPGKAVAFIVDEVGAYVAQSVERIEGLRVVVEEFGKESKNRLKRRQAVGPVWVVVTSQEKLDEVVESLDSKRVEIARLRDRFRWEVDLSPADIREVATRRVLAKTDAGRAALEALYDQHEGRINLALKLEHTARRSTVSRRDFVEFYPYPPHFVDLSIEIMSGIRLQPGAARHLGGSNRTIIKQAYEMLASERTRLAAAPVGRLVSLDLVFELVEGNLASEKQRDISEIGDRFGLESWEVRVAKALALMEFVRDLPRTPGNLAAVLVDQVGAAPPAAEVRQALDRLEEAEFVRHTTEGYKLQTASEKNWSTERRAIDLRPRDRGEILRGVLGELFAEPGVKVQNYQGLRSFRLGLVVEGAPVDEGHVTLAVTAAADGGRHAQAVQEARELSRYKEHASQVFWVWASNPEIEAAVAEFHRSQVMVNRYQQRAAQGTLPRDEEACLANEKHEVTRFKGRLKERVLQALVTGTGVFQGVSKDGPTLGASLREIVTGLVALAIPRLYEKLEVGARPLAGNEADLVLTAATLNSLPKVLYEPGGGLGVIRKEGAKFVVNADAPVAREIMGYIRDRHAYNEKVTGKALEAHFGGLGYGWEGDLIRLVAAVLLRAGVMEVTHQGRRYRDHTDPMARHAITNKPAFRAATFSPRVAVSRRLLADAAERLEAMTGREVDPEEGALARAARELALAELEWLVGLHAEFEARQLPGRTELESLKQALEGLRAAAPDECVQLLADEGERLAAAIRQGRGIRDAAKAGVVADLVAARWALERLWPEIRAREGAFGEETAEAAARLERLVETAEALAKIEEVRAGARELRSGYVRLYQEAHGRRAAAAAEAVEAVRSREEWRELFPEGSERDAQARERMQELLAPLSAMDCVGDTVAVEPGAAPRCEACGAELGRLEADLATVGRVAEEVIRRLQEAATPPEMPLRRIRVGELWQRPIQDEEDARTLLARLEEALLKALAAGGRVVVE